ncbi:MULTISPECIES: hypothetical protein [unclassified Lysinibacillus]|uniref:hypothetical protein n=1 Tax=unclassified Lysinibacillus TaxID=2636778 RepID=UPI0035DB10B7
MKIGFVHSEKSYLPEIHAYEAYCNNQEKIVAEIITNEELVDINDNDFDVLWKFPGIDVRRNFKNVKVIHEYNSLSTGNFPLIKNYLKRKYNMTPDGKVFLNEKVKRDMNTADKMPVLIRDMGIAKQFFTQNSKKEFDFVYVGAMGRNRGLSFALQPFTSTLKHKSILLIGRPDNDLYAQYKNNANIIFTGVIPYAEIPSIASKAVFGFNYMPDIYPFNVQASTKLLEYCALGLKIVTSEYLWLREFEKQRDGCFYKLNANLDNFTSNELDRFQFKTPDVQDLEWNQLFHKIDLLGFLNRVVRHTAF